MDNTEYIPGMFVGSGTPTAVPLAHSGASRAPRPPPATPEHHNLVQSQIMIFVEENPPKMQYITQNSQFGLAQ